MVELQYDIEPLPTQVIVRNGTNLVLRLDLLVAQSLMIPLSMFEFAVIGMSPEQFEQNG